MPASYEIIGPYGFGVSAVRYTGIDTRGVRDTVTETPLSPNTVEIRKAQNGDRLQSIKTDHAGIRYRELKSGKLVSKERWENAERFQGPGGGRGPDRLAADQPADDGTDYNYRNLVYGGVTSSSTDDEIQIAVWNVNREVDDPIPFDQLRDSWWGRAKGIAYGEIGPVAEDVAVRGTEENERIDPDEVREFEKPIGKVHGVVLVQKSFGERYAYEIDWDRGRLERLGSNEPKARYAGVRL